jgi:hypothetical protein
MSYLAQIIQEYNWSPFGIILNNINTVLDLYYELLSTSEECTLYNRGNLIKYSRLGWISAWPIPRDVVSVSGRLVSRRSRDPFLKGLDLVSVSDIFLKVSSRTENQTSRSRSLRSRLQVTFSTVFPSSLPKQRQLNILSNRVSTFINVTYCIPQW